MNPTDKRHVLKLIRQVRAAVQEEISGNASRGGKAASGLSAEGYAGGYRDCLDDVEAALMHGYPSDNRGYWERARQALAGDQS